MENILEIVQIKYIIIYFIIINLIGFIAMFWDKQKAKANAWRIPEKTLFIITALGGGIGTITGMYTFHHKTKKIKFIVGLPTILICEIIFIIYLFFNFL